MQVCCCFQPAGVYGALDPAGISRCRVALLKIDYDGLQVAWLDESGRIDYYLDLATGEVVERREGDRGPLGDAARFVRVPGRSASTEAEDRRQFLTGVEDEQMQATLSGVLDDPGAFRGALAEDRSLERAWYNFKNDRATAAIAAWLQSRGLG
jgi:hypothetical protein